MAEAIDPFDLLPEGAIPLDDEATPEIEEVDPLSLLPEGATPIEEEPAAPKPKPTMVGIESRDREVEARTGMRPDGTFTTPEAKARLEEKTRRDNYKFEDSTTVRGRGRPQETEKELDENTARVLAETDLGTDDTTLVGEFRKGFLHSGGPGNANMTANSLRAIMEATGEDSPLLKEIADDLTEAAAGMEGQLDKPTYEDWDSVDFWSEGGFGRFFDFMAGKAGEGTASSMPGIAGGFAGGALGKYLKLGKIGQGAGAILGATSGAMLLNTGDAYETITQEGITDPAIRGKLALQIGGAMSVFDGLLPAQIASRFTGPAKRELSKAFAKRMLQRMGYGVVGAGQGAVVEGGTESIQDTLKSVWAKTEAGNPISGEALMDQAWESFIGGAAGGAFMSGVTEPLHGQVQKPSGTPPPEIPGEAPMAPKVVNGKIVPNQPATPTPAPTSAGTPKADKQPVAQAGAIDITLPNTGESFPDPARAASKPEPMSIEEEVSILLNAGIPEDQVLKMDGKLRNEAAKLALSKGFKPTPDLMKDLEARAAATNAAKAPTGPNNLSEPEQRDDGTYGYGDRQGNGDGTKQKPVKVETEADMATVRGLAGDPTPGQAEAGNYQKVHVKVHDYDIAIENPKGSIRKSKDPENPWEVTMPADYGYIKGTKGRDGDPIDVFIGPNPKSGRVFIIEQNDARTDEFDEHKIIMGASNEEEAIDLYERSFSDGRGQERLGYLEEMDISQFQSWIDGNQGADTPSRRDEAIAALPEGATPVDEPAAAPADDDVEPTSDAVMYRIPDDTETSSRPRNKNESEGWGKFKGFASTNEGGRLAVESWGDTPEQAETMAKKRLETELWQRENKRRQKGRDPNENGVYDDSKGEKIEAHRDRAHVIIKVREIDGRWYVAESHQLRDGTGGGSPLTKHTGFDKREDAVRWQAKRLIETFTPALTDPTKSQKARDDARAFIAFLNNVRETAKNPPAENKPAPKTPPQKGKDKPAKVEKTYKSIGRNKDGHALWEDDRGVRSYTKDGIRITEKVSMRPTKGGMELDIKRPADPEFEPFTEEKKPEPEGLSTRTARSFLNIKISKVKDKFIAEYDLRLTSKLTGKNGTTLLDTREATLEQIAGRIRTHLLGNRDTAINNEGAVILEWLDKQIGGTTAKATPRITVNSPREDIEKAFPKWKDQTNGIAARPEIPNLSSIDSSINEPESLPVIREVSFSVFESAEAPKNPDSYTRELAAKIKESGELNPLIVVIDAEGPYVLEGAHRFDALLLNGTPSFPAKVVLDLDNAELAPEPVDLKVNKPETAEKPADDFDSLFDEALDEQFGNPLERLRAKAIIFASGMSRPKDMEAGAVWAGLNQRGIGVDIGELSGTGMAQLATQIAEKKQKAFVDSGAFSKFRASLRQQAKLEADAETKAIEALDFEAVMGRYDALADKIAEANAVEDQDVPLPLFVMPDVVGDQAASLDLAKQYAKDIGLWATTRIARPVVPIQKGDLTLAEVYKELVTVVGSDNFVVGIPSNEKAVSLEELTEFLKTARPKAIHFLGTASEKRVMKKLEAVAASGHEPEHVSFDANILRSALYGSEFEGTRQQAVQDTLRDRAAPEIERESLSPEERKAADAAKSAGKNLVMGLDDVAKGLKALFNDPDTIGMAGAFNDETYEKALPYFRAAIAHFKDAGTDTAEVIRALIKFLNEKVGFDRAGLERMRPYAKQFVEDLKAGKEPPKAEETEKPSDKKPETERSPGASLAQSIADQLEGNESPVGMDQLTALAEVAYGGTMAEGKYDRKDLYDAIELGINLYVLKNKNRADPIAGVEGAREVAKWLRKITNRFPTQTVRSQEQIEFQQFSTPPDYAYAVVWAANATGEDVGLEPSAGTGNIFTPLAIATRGRAIANELSKRRAELVKLLRPRRVYTEDAEQLNNILPPDVKPTVIVMNPPFSQTAGRMGDKKDLMVAARHIEQALKRLAPGGRLVAIVGGGTDNQFRKSEGMSLTSPTYRDWFTKIRGAYQLRANVLVSGDIYTKNGTSFRTRVLIIDKVTPDSAIPVLSNSQAVDNIPGLITLLEEVRHARNPVTVQPAQPVSPAQPGGEESTGEGGRGDEQSGRPAPVDAGAVGNGEGPAGNDTQGTLAGSKGPRRPSVRRGPGQGASLDGEQSQRPDSTGTEGQPSKGNRRGGNAGAGSATSPRDDTGQSSAVDIEVAEQEAHTGEISDSVYESYKPERLRIPGAKPHPGPLVQSAAMASVSPPTPTYKPNLPKEVVTNGDLSDAQLEAVVYAGQAHSRNLPSAEAIEGEEAPKEFRRGFFIGDGTGVGKGREIAGIFLDNWRQGRKKGVWVTEKAPLINDARRDWKGLGGDEKMIFDSRKSPMSGDIKADRGIAFTTYDTLKSGMDAAAKAARGGLPKGQKVRISDNASAVNNHTGTVVGPDKEASKRFRANYYKVKLEDGTFYTGLAGHLEPVGDKVESKSRLDQLVKWLGADFDGVIAFDEAHNMANAVAQKGKRGNKEASQKALAGLELQRRLPKARIVYVSATGATELSNLAYAERLGLWGRGTAFPRLQEFLAGVGEGGIAAMELIARDMKALGSYIARNLSFDGVEYDRVEHTLTSPQREIYDQLAAAWQVVLKNIHKALEETGAVPAEGESGPVNKGARSAALSAFWGAHQRFFNQIITSMQMPSVLAGVERDLADGKQVVLQLVNTNEAGTERAVAAAQEAGEDLEDLDLTPRDQLIGFLQKSFPVEQYEDYVDENGNTRSRPVVDSQGNPVLNPEAVAMRDQMIAEMAAIRVPDSPLDFLIDKLGSDTVAEVTGRKRRFIRKRDETTGEMRRVEDKRAGSANVAEADAFQEGKKKVLVFSNAGGTGRSYHADNKSKSKGARRVHYLVQAGWRADIAVQGFGRTHRTNQASAPIFRLVTTDLKGQKRFISSIARRLGQLGALTKGQRQAGDQGAFSAKDNLEGTEAREALQIFYRRLADGSLPNVYIDEFEEQTGLTLRLEHGGGALREDLPPISQFLNRLLSMKIDMQNLVFDHFEAIMESLIDMKTAAGTLDVGLSTLKASKIEKASEQVVYTNEESGAETKHVKLRVSDKTHPRKWEDIEDAEGFVRSVRHGHVYALFPSKDWTQPDGTIVTTKRKVGTIASETVAHEKVLNEKEWTVVPREQAKAAWTEELTKTPEFHARDVHMITGTVLPIWDRLRGSARIMRAQTEKGERFLGRIIDNDQIAQTLQRLGVNPEAEQMSTRDVLNGILEGGMTADLANGWKISKRTVAGEDRLELIGPQTYGEGQQAVQDGAIREIIQGRSRLFIPTGANAERVFKAITKFRPVVSLDGVPVKATSGDPLPGSRVRAPQPADRPFSNGRKLTVADAERLGTAITTIAERMFGRWMPTIELDLDPDTDEHGALEGSWNRQAWVMKLAIRVSQDPRFTLRHEGIHLLRTAGAFTAKEWATLSRIARNKWVKEFDIEARYRTAYASLDVADWQVEEMLIEEAVAEAFRAYALRGPIGSASDAIFEKLKRFLEAVANLLSGRGFNSVADIFEAIEAGEMGQRDTQPGGAREWDLRREKTLPDLNDVEANRAAFLAGQDPDAFEESITADMARGIERHTGAKKFLENLFGNEGQRQKGKGTPEFREWFGKSTVTDHNGDPLMVYHATAADFDTFMETSDIGYHFGDRDQAEKRLLQMKGINALRGESSRKAWDEAIAGHPNRKPFQPDEDLPTAVQDGLIMPVYIKMEKPLYMQDLGLWETDKLAAELQDAGLLTEKEAAEYIEGYIGYDYETGGEGEPKSGHGEKYLDRETVAAILAKQGYDGIIYENKTEGVGVSYIVFDSTQVKSAVGNRGGFNKERQAIVAARPPRPRSPTPGQQRRRTIMRRNLGFQPIDRVIRLPFEFFGALNAKGEWNAAKNLSDKTGELIRNARFNDRGRFSFLNPWLHTARAGLSDRYGLSKEYVDRSRKQKLEERALLREGVGIIEQLRDAHVGPAEAQVIQALLTGETITDPQWDSLSDPIKQAIDSHGQELVDLGLIPQESYDRNKGKYLHRVYVKHESNQGRLIQWAHRMQSTRRKRLIGDEFKGRGKFWKVPLAKIGQKPPQKGTMIQILEKMSANGNRVLKRVYLAAGEPTNTPEFQDFTHKGEMEVRGYSRGRVILWRDWTKAERVQMGEIFDARYTIAKTYMLMAHDLSVGRFYKDISENPDWTTLAEPPRGTWMEAGDWGTKQRLIAPGSEVEWVRVPDAKIPKSNTKRYAALSGKWVRAEIWRDLHELELMQREGTWNEILKIFKVNKTARSPVVHMNNIMSNVMLMDASGVGMADLTQAIRSMVKGDAEYRAAEEAGAFGVDMATQELRKNVLQPILDEIANQPIVNSPTGQIRLLSHIANGIFSRGALVGAMYGFSGGMFVGGPVGAVAGAIAGGMTGAALRGPVEYVDNKMLQLYQLEDEVFRMALFHRRRKQGFDAQEAADEAREQFIDYDIRAPWVNMARRSFLPFVAYIYRAAPIMARTVATRPWKVAKYATLLYGLNVLSHAILGDDDDKEDRERASMHPTSQGWLWMGPAPIGHRMIRLPFTDDHGNTLYLDARRWMPAGDVFDTEQGHSAIALPAWMQPSGPIMMAFEILLNKQAFTGKEIVNDETDDFWDKTSKITDWVWKGFMPSAFYIPDSWYWTKVMDAWRGVAPRAGEPPHDMSDAIISSLGVKVRGQDIEEGQRYGSYRYDRVERELKSEIRRLQRDRARGRLGEPEFRRALEKKLEQLKRNAEGRREMLSGKPE